MNIHTDMQEGFLIYSPEMKEWLTKADEKLIMYPVFPLEMKGKINLENENG